MDELEESKRAAVLEESRRAAALMRLARIKLLNNIVLVNALIIGFVAFSVGYSILEVDLKATAALFYFRAHGERAGGVDV